MGAESEEPSVNGNPGQQGGWCVKTCPELVRDPGRLLASTPQSVVLVNVGV